MGGGYAGASEDHKALLTGFGLDPVESAITNAAQAAREADGLALMILQRHLKQLCELQMKQLSSK